MKKVIVVGGGAAGMLAAITAGRNGAEVELFEKNEKLGKKLYITGKGRCNLTNACDIDALFAGVVTNANFLYSSFYTFSNESAISFFEEIGLKTKIERGMRVFPQSDHSSDVIRVLFDELKRLKVRIHFLSEVKKVICEQGKFQKIMLADGSAKTADACIVATGGLSYSSTGSTGDGYRFAKECGHTVTELTPSLTSIHVKEDFVSELEGLSLKNIQLRVTEKDGKKQIYEGFGEMLFTRFGVSGPLILSASSYISSFHKKSQLVLHLDLKPALSEAMLDARILKDFSSMKNKQFKNALDQLLPQKIIHVMIKESAISPEKQLNSITKDERSRLVKQMKDFILEVESLGGYNEAVITKGGICVKEVNPSTMESKVVKDLYFAGEVLDLDALTGGYNLQIAWSTGYMAGLAQKNECSMT